MESFDGKEQENFPSFANCEEFPENGDGSLDSVLVSGHAQNGLTRVEEQCNVECCLMQEGPVVNEEPTPTQLSKCKKVKV